MNRLEKYEDKMIRNNVKPDANSVFDLSGYKWIEKEVLEKRIVEMINERDYNLFITAIERLAKMPYSSQAKDFITGYCESLMSQTKIMEVPKLKYDADGRAYITTYGMKTFEILVHKNYGNLNYGFFFIFRVFTEDG